LIEWLVIQPVNFFAFILRMGSSDEVKTKAQEEVEKGAAISE